MKKIFFISCNLAEKAGMVVDYMIEYISIANS